MPVLSRKRRSSRLAFTLVEMLVVVAIILALAAIAVPITLASSTAAKRDIAKSQCKGLLSGAVKAYQLDRTFTRRPAADLMGPSSVKPKGQPQAGIHSGSLAPPVSSRRSEPALITSTASTSGPTAAAPVSPSAIGDSLPARRQERRNIPCVVASRSSRC